jgi:hypothetical protein
MRRSFYLLALAFTTIAFTSCQKSDVLNQQQSIEGTWAITAISSDRAYDWNGDGRLETDIYGTYTYCQRDIIIVFDANGGGQIRQGCNASWQNISWRLSNNSRNLDISLPGDELSLSLSQFDDYTIRGTDPVYAEGNSFSINYTFQRK